MNMTTKAKKAVAASALLLSGLGIGAAVAGTTSATAATTAVTTTAADTAQSLDPTKPMRSDEQLLTGTTAAKVKAAALAKYPNATVQRIETDSDGVYEAHIVTSAGDQVIVQVGKDFAVTGTQTGGGHGPADTTTAG
jgi:predicted  nucleic acid-binding Zn-ribbon protein